MIKYAGIGSRQTPESILDHMDQAAYDLAFQGALLRSGGAYGADQAFEAGHNAAVLDGAKASKEIFTAKDATEEALELAKEYHPNWGACSAYVRKLHARNGMIVLGERLNDPVDFVICWTRGGTVSGGTGQALRIAKDLDIDVVNYGDTA